MANISDSAASATTAASATPAAPPLDISPFASLFTTAISLAFVLGLAWLLLRWLRRTRVERGGGDAPEVLHAVSLGPRERLVVARHRDTEFLLGVTAASVTVIERHRVVATEPVEPSL